ncbi:META domain-containing protein [Halobacteriovorax sp. HLS]|uniref:META domain-containing protein n=1 Tax=Halobacteriovorax sp. HLS TaxID=2234000 RepID=UPI000FD80A5D|nr:META domain-containing protein [Halobacteriovorax sp. HLS]
MKLTAILPLILLFSSCQMNPTSKTQNIFGKWKIVSILNKEVSTKLNPYIIINEDLSVKGNNGCNNFFANLIETKGIYTFSKMGATKRLCDDQANMMEFMFNKITSSTKNIIIKDNMLNIISKANETIVATRD